MEGISWDFVSKLEGFTNYRGRRVVLCKSHHSHVYLSKHESFQSLFEIPEEIGSRQSWAELRPHLVSRSWRRERRGRLRLVSQTRASSSGSSRLACRGSPSRSGLSRSRWSGWCTSCPWSPPSCTTSSHPRPPTPLVASEKALDMTRWKVFES